jgi:hypothetical protein
MLANPDYNQPHTIYEKGSIPESETQSVSRSTEELPSLSTFKGYPQTFDSIRSRDDRVDIMLIDRLCGNNSDLHLRSIKNTLKI